MQNWCWIVKKVLAQKLRYFFRKSGKEDKYKSKSGTVAPLADIPEFGQFMTMFSNPILGMIAGAIFTTIIQSSSTSVGILQALCATGSIPFSVALPVIMGQNIGTCIKRNIVTM